MNGRSLRKVLSVFNPASAFLLNMPRNLGGIVTCAEWIYCQNRIKSQRPIFVIGCQHSGTSITHRLIGYHTAVFQIPQESYWFKGGQIKSKAKREILSILNILHLFHADAFLEKTPSHFGSMGLIKSIFPKSKFIFMFRDPRDVAASLKARGSSLERACHEWNRAAESFAVNYEKDSVICVRLEDLLQNPGCKLEEIQQFIGLEPEDLQSRHGFIPNRFYSRDPNRPSSVEDGHNHNTNRNWQINQPLFADSRRWHKDLSSNEVSFVIKSTLPGAKLIGYSLG